MNGESIDVVICGGGLAGLGLALQLRRQIPALRVRVLERQVSPLPASTHKVGESTLEGGGWWLREALGLGDVLERDHLRKLGLRFFGAGHGSAGAFGERFEVGSTDFSAIPSYQLDRGVLEETLRERVREAGAILEEGCTVRDIALDATLDGDGPHEVRYTAAGEDRVVRARWVVDAMGRRRFLQTRLGLGLPQTHRVSACWWRAAGEREVDALGPPPPAPWRQRTRQRRWFSTNHLLGQRYWVWTIPLRAGVTSVGIVADDDRHPIAARADHAGALDWLRRNEPALAGLLAGAEALDFHALKRFTLRSSRVFSPRRWCCIGEAAVFTDPLYSMGTEVIAWACTITARMLALDHQGALTPALVDAWDALFLEAVDGVMALVQDMYPVLGDDRVMLGKLLWDHAFYWGVMARAPMSGALAREDLLPRYGALTRRAAALNRRAQALFRGWSAARPRDVAPPGLYSLRACDFTNALRLDLMRDESAEGWLDTLGDNLDRAEAALGAMLTIARQEAPDLTVDGIIPSRDEALVRSLMAYWQPVAA